MSALSLRKQDSQFVVDYCINAPWPLYETTQEMLNYAKVRVRGGYLWLHMLVRSCYSLHSLRGGTSSNQLQPLRK